MRLAKQCLEPASAQIERRVEDTVCPAFGSADDGASQHGSICRLKTLNTDFDPPNPKPRLGSMTAAVDQGVAPGCRFHHIKYRLPGVAWRLNLGDCPPIS
jgi:hypothetical protein